jgi:hypothetical protein
MPKNKPLRLVIDTNLWISFLISDRQRKLDTLLYTNQIQLLFSEELLDEIHSTITKPKLQKYFSADALKEMLLTLEPYIHLIEVGSRVEVCRDPKDTFYWHFAKTAKQIFYLPATKTC